MKKKSVRQYVYRSLPYKPKYLCLFCYVAGGIFGANIQLFKSHSHQFLTLLATTVKRQQRRHQLLLEQVATNLLMIRPERSEQGVLKRRPKPYPRMQEPRSVLKSQQRA